MEVIIGATTLQPLAAHLPVPAFWQPGATAMTITMADYTPIRVQSVQLWNRGGTDLYINFNGVTATGQSPTSTDLHLAPGEEWAGAVQVTSLSVISPGGPGALELQVWG